MIPIAPTLTVRAIYPDNDTKNALRPFYTRTGHFASHKRNARIPRKTVAIKQLRSL